MMTYNKDEKRYEFIYDLNGKEECFYVTEKLLDVIEHNDLMTLFSERIGYIIADCLSECK